MKTSQLILLLCFLIYREQPCLGEKHGVTVRDCVQVRYIKGLWMNHQGSKVAYLVKTPNLEHNRNDDQLYVKDIASETTDSGTLIATGAGITDVAWSGDGSSLAMLMPVNGVQAVVEIEANNGRQKSVLTEGAKITSYSIDDTGNTIAYGAEDTALGSHLPPAHLEDDVANGYRVSFDEHEDTAVLPTYSLYLRHRTAEGQWGSPQRITIRDPFTQKTISNFPVLTWPSLSPNGKRLLFDYYTETSGLPAAWKDSPWVQESISENSAVRIMVLEDLTTDSATVAIKTLYPDSVAVWSRDSASFLVNAHSPVGSIWEQEDIRDHRISGPDANMFLVEANTGRTELVFRHVPAHHEVALYWRSDGDIIVHGQNDSVLRLHQSAESWQQIEHVDIPHSDEDRFAAYTSTGTAIVGIHETVSTPEDLFLYRPGEPRIRMVTDLNPQLKRVRFAPVKTIHWTTSEGLNVSGLLFMPPDYVHGTLYPLVIQTKGDQGWFTCDSGFNHDPSFAPQPIANSGMMYLIRTTEEGHNYQDEKAKQPKGYPGQISEAIQQMDIWDSAVSALSAQGLVDPKKLGIIGFSRTGWYVEFMLTQSPLHFAAATAADFMQLSLSEYWLIPSAKGGAEGFYGGPPYGETLPSWMKYSISFNLEKVHTPLLMEQMGYGVHDDIQGSKPVDLMLNYEIFGGLGRLGKPVELYYYPNEDHQPDHPKARLATLQRNVDWYRFWLQGYEDPDEEKREQYVRWRHLRGSGCRGTKGQSELTALSTAFACAELLDLLSR